MLDQLPPKTILEAKVIDRAVLYARVSSDDTKKDGRNLQGQLAMGRKYAQSKGYRIVAELAEDDRGASGAEIDLPELNRVRDMARRGEFEALIVREIDRLSRNLAKQLIVEEELKRAGVRIEYVLADYEDSPEGRLSKHIRATIAEYEREKIRERGLRGKRNKVKAGSVMMSGNAPYGYKRIEKDGKWQLEIVPDEARIVRLIFRWYTQGDGENGPLSTRKIIRKLAELGIPTPSETGTRKIPKKRKKNEWARESILQMLKNETYVGVWHFGKTKIVNGKQRKNTDDNILTVTVPAIIDRNLWESAQMLRKQNRQKSRRNRKRKYLLAGHVICGKCGASAGSRTKERYKYYYCYAANGNLIQTCRAPYFRADHVDEKVWDWLKAIMSDPDYLKERLIEYQTKQDEVCQPLLQRLTIVKELLAENRAKLEKLLDLYLSGDFSRDILTERKTSLETTIGSLETEQAKLSDRLQQETLTPEVIEDVLEYAAKLRENLDLMTDDFEEKRWFIKRLKVEVRLVVEDGQKVAHVSCCIGEDVLPIAPKASQYPTQAE